MPQSLPATPSFDLSAYLAARREAVEAALIAAIGSIDDAPPELLSAMEHALLAGGKRLRPILCVAAAEAVGARDHTIKNLLPAACALEFIHAYSLAHDDLPAMDNDELRRGEPTVHVAFGEAEAILAGDALNTEAFALIAGCSDVPAAARLDAVAILARAAGAAGMVGGQHIDCALEGLDATVAEVTDLARRKTGALLTAACEMGAVLAGAPPELRAALRAYGAGMGLAFQVTDDLLDATGDAAVVGKKTQKDDVVGKNTFVKVLGIDGARTLAAQLVGQAVAALTPLGDSARPLAALAESVVHRTR